MKTVRLKDVAQACGVSVATVSRALNGQADETKPLTEMICRKAGEMGYVQNAAAFALKTNRSSNIGILYEDQMHHEFFSALLNDLRRQATARGYDLTLIGETDRETGNYYEHTRRRNLDGVIVIQADFDSAGVIRLASSSMPSVVIDHMYDGCDCVGSDNRAGMMQIVRYAWERGHRRLAYITGERGAVSRERTEGFYRGCAELGIRVPEKYVQEGHFHDPEDCFRRIHALMEEADPVTCILCPDDYSCFGAMLKLKEEGIRVPEDISLVGYDGIAMGQMISPRLTTYRQNTEEIGREAVDLLVEAIEEPERHAPRHITVEGRMIEGETVQALSR